VKIGALILAAGYSSRMDGFKPLMTLGGKTLLAHSAGIFQSAGVTTVSVVTGHRCKEVEAEAARLGLGSIHNPEYDRGMFSSVLRALQEMQQLDAFFILPVDIPLLYPSTIASLIEAFDGRSVLLPVFCGEQGHPPLIPGDVIPAIRNHNGEGGLRTILETLPCLDIPVWDRGILMDADTPADFAALESRLSRMGIGEKIEASTLATLLMPERGVAHGRAAAEIAVQLGRALNDSGKSLNLELLHNAALLHDVGKGVENHEAHGAEMLRHLGLGKLSSIVAAHRNVAPPPSGKLTEKEVVCLADKLVSGSRRVSVQQRFSEKLTLYADDAEACAAIRGRLADALAVEDLVKQTTGRSMQEILKTLGES
jgi:molybdenum cofactor cytidylyltransferase